jgi:hypothetical protein
MIDLNALAGNRYKLEWEVNRGVDVIPCRYGEIGIWSGDALYACTRDSSTGLTLQAMDGVRVRGWKDAWGHLRLILIFEPRCIDAVAEVMGAERLVSEAVARPVNPRPPAYPFAPSA